MSPKAPASTAIQRESPKESKIHSYEDIYNALINEAPYISGNESELIPTSEIPWVKPELLKESHEFYRNNVFAIFLLNSFMMIFSFFFPQMAALFIRSGGLVGQENSFKRWLSTADRFRTWYDDDLLSVKSRAYKNIKYARKVHAISIKMMKTSQNKNDVVKEAKSPEFDLLSKAIRKDLEYFSSDESPINLFTKTPQVPFNQYDLAIGVFGEVVPLYIASKFFGFSDLNGREAYVHRWAVLGRLLGLEDRFNVAINPDPKLFDRILTDIVANFKFIEEETFHLPNYLVSAFRKRLYFITLKSFLYLALTTITPEFGGKSLYSIMSWYDKLCYYVIIFFQKCWPKFGITKKGLNWIAPKLQNYAFKFYFPNDRYSHGEE